MLKTITDLNALLVLTMLTALVAGCGGGGSSGGNVPSAKVSIATSGVAQKGPLLKGSNVTAQELDSKLSPTGKQYTYQIDSDLGTFAPTSKFSSPYIGLNATGYYYDEVLDAISTGTLSLQGVSDLDSNTTLNVNLLSTLAYQRIKTLVSTQGMTVAAASTQAEEEVLKAFYIYNGHVYGNFGGLDISKHRDGDNILAAISSVFVYGNNAGNLSSLIAAFQSDIADNGIIDTPSTVAALVASAKALNPATVAANLTAKYTGVTTAYAATDISDWIDQDGDGVIGRFKAQVTDATSSSTYTLPAAFVSYLAGQTLTISAGQMTINGNATTGTFTLKSGDTVIVSPAAGNFPAGGFSIYLRAGTTNLARVNFVKGVTSLSITPANPAVVVGFPTALTATASFTDGSSPQAISGATWSSSDTNFATVDANGVVTGVAQGVPTISATYGGVTGSTSVSVIVLPTPTTLATGAHPYGIVVNATNVYWTDYGNSTAGTSSVNIVPKAGGLVTAVAAGATTIQPNGIAVDANRVYWTEGAWGKVTSYQFANATTNILTPTGIISDVAFGIAVDAVNVYWTAFPAWVAQGTGYLYKAPLAGGAITTLATGLSNSGTVESPQVLAVDATNVYWTDSSAGTVNKVAIAGGTPTTLASGLSQPYSIAIDSTSIYWTELGSAWDKGSVKKVAIAGGTVTTLASGLKNADGIAVDATNVYWTEGSHPVLINGSWVNYNSNGAVMKAPITGGAATPVAAGLQGSIHNIAVDSANVYWTEWQNSAGTGTVMKTPK